MCTALSFSTKSHYFGRTLDLDCSYGEEVCVVPRRFPVNLRHGDKIECHYAMIGMATVVCDVPLFYDGVNEYGLAMAGLNFPGNAYYAPLQEDKTNIAPFEFIPYVLGSCKTVSEVRGLLEGIILVDTPFSDELPNSPLHWIISDKNESIVAEFMEDGIHLHNNPVGVLTNNPPFEYQLFNLNNYRGLNVCNGANSFSDKLNLDTYCQGLGAVGLPGDVSSMSRFVRMAFNKLNAVCEGDEEASVNRFFHLMSSVEMNRGCCRTDSGEWDITVYTSCMSTERGLYYYTTYGNHRISCVDMNKTDLEGSAISRFPLVTDEQICYCN